MQKNIARKPLHITHVINANSYLQKLIGMIGKTPHRIYFQTRWGIHTLGMQFPIDVIILNDLFLVKKIKKSLRPGYIFLWNPIYKHVIELPEKSIDKLDITLNEKVVLEFKQ